jgi:DNA-binding NtrC family response regulator
LHRPDDFKTARAVFSPTSRPLDGRFRLEVTSGPDRGLVAEFDDSLPSALLIGTSEACGLRLTDTTCSRRHASVELVDGAPVIRDLASTNGLYVGDVRVFEAPLADRQVLRLGDTCIGVSSHRTEPHGALDTRTRFGAVLGQSREMRRLYPILDRLAQTDVPILIEGETGTGKEVLAEALHEAGQRARMPFVVFDCTTVARGLLESELFGHERGAFTGATATRPGVFEQAHGGTLLIDEIGDLDTALQPKLLRVLESRELRRVGGSQSIRVDVRVLAATRRDLDHEIQVGRFRDDLFHRLAVARVALPPLRRRRGDVGLLVRDICERMGSDPAKIPPAILARWDQAEWPGNVRELRNAVMHYVALGETPEEQEASGASEDSFADVLALDLPLVEARRRVVEAFERQYLEKVLADHQGVVTRAAEASGVARRHFHRLLASRGKPRKAGK